MRFHKITLFCLILLLSKNLLAVPSTSQKVMISSESLGAILAGQTIARQGGNVVDIAVASALAMSVELPQSASLGGGGFALIKIGSQVDVLDYREVAPNATSPDFYKTKPKTASIDGAHAIGVPGVVAGLYALHKKYGRLKWKRLFKPALQIARKGFIISTEMHEIIKSNAARFSTAGHTLLMNKKQAKRPGDTIKYRGMYAALKRIRRKGHKGFYEGPVAKDIINTITSLGGVMTLEDLLNYKVRWLKPITLDFKGYKVYSMPLPSTGGIVLASALRLTQKLNLNEYSPFSSMEAHLIAETLARAFRGRSLLGDSDFFRDSPHEMLLSNKYLEDLGKTIELKKTLALPPLIIPKKKTSQQKESNQTTHLAVIDHQGNAVSLTTTLNGNFGSGVFSQKFGISLNNEMDDFTTRPGQPNMFGLIQGLGNKVEPGKRPLSSMSPTIVTKDGKAVLALGARGGPRIISAVFQVIYRVLVNGFDIDLAVQSPRIHHQFLPHIVFYDSHRISQDVLDNLKKKGHKLKSGSIGKVIAVGRRKDNILVGTFDARGVGKAAGL